MYCLVSSASPRGWWPLCGLLVGDRLYGWTALFLATTVATSVTGFGFSRDHIMPSHVVGVISLVALAAAIFARYARHFAGSWHWIYTIGAVLSLYLNVFVLIVQAFAQIPVARFKGSTLASP